MSTVPYFQNQQPNRCGHYYPDSMRSHDSREGSRYFRHLDCVFCGPSKHEIVWHCFCTEPGIQGMSLGELNVVRERERERLRLYGGWTDMA